MLLWCVIGFWEISSASWKSPFEKKKKSICNIIVEIIPCLATETPETYFIDEKLLKIMALGPHARPIESEWPWVGPGIVWFKSSPGGSNVHWGLKSHCSSPSAALNWFFSCFLSSWITCPSLLHPTPSQSVPFFPFYVPLHSTLFHWDPFYLNAFQWDWLAEWFNYTKNIYGRPTVYLMLD